MQESLIKIQQALKAPKSNKNAFGNYMYRSAEDILEAVKPLAHAEGLTLLLSDDVRCIGDRNYVEATATLSKDKDNMVQVTALAREAETKKGMDEAQITGSASSYARKYALSGLFAIDDTKDPDTQDNRDHVPEKLATPKQKKLIADKLEVIGVTGRENIKSYIASEWGISDSDKLTTDDASMIIEDLIAGGGNG